MSVLRKEEPITTADIANRQRHAGTNADNAVIDPTPIDPTDRRPPQSAAGTGTVEDIGDTYDGEIVTSTTEAPVGNSDRRPVSEAAPTSRSGVSASRANVAASQPPSSTAQAPDARSNGALFADDELRDFRGRWDQVQTSFVDEPRHAVEQADTLVATVIKRIAEQFAGERAKLEEQWDSGDNVSTEDLRQGFKRYRAFFDRLLSF